MTYTSTEELVRVLYFVRKRPGMFIMPLTLSSLGNLIGGYRLCCTLNHIHQDEYDFLVYVPDMEIYTEGRDFADAIEMARDAIGLKGIDLEDDGKELPYTSNHEQAIKKAKEDTEIFDYSTGMLTFVDVDFSEYRKRVGI